MPIRQKLRYDRSGNIVAALPDDIKAQVLQIAHERVLARSKDNPEIPAADAVLEEAKALLKFFDQ